MDTFDEIFRTEGLTILKSPVRTPVANTFAEQWIGTIRRELLDHHHLEPAPTRTTHHRLPRPLQPPATTPLASETPLRTSAAFTSGNQPDATR
jgi:hypothetical protein